MNATAPVVSRVLRAAGFMITSTRQRQGLYVHRRDQDTSWVTATFDSERRAIRFATEAKEVLAEEGYDVQQCKNSLLVKEG